MSKEAYTVAFDRESYHAPIAVGRQREDVLAGREKDIKEGMLKYLAEYRLGVKFDEFYYRQEKNPLSGEEYLAANEPGPVKRKFKKAIASRMKHGLPVHREEAECRGFEKLEQELANTDKCKLFVWVSYPGSKEEGYGDYSFTFVGQTVVTESGERKIRVIPYRNVLSLEEHRDYLARLDPKARVFHSDVDFLANPVVFSPTAEFKTPEDIIRFIGEKEEISTAWSNRLSKYINPLINRYLELIKANAGEKELRKTRNAIENFTISVKNKIMSTKKTVAEGPVTKEELDETITLWGREEPPQVAGSCGITKLTLMEYQETNKSWEYHRGDCVLCESKNVEVGPCNICKRCEKKIDEKER